MIGVISLRDYCRLAAAHGVLDIDFDPGDTYAYVCTTPEGAPLANQDCGRIFSTPAAALRHWASRHHLDRDQLEAAVSLFPYPDLTRQRASGHLIPRPVVTYRTVATGNTALSLIAFGYLEPNPSSPILAFPGARTAHETRSMCPHGCGTPITTTQARAKHYDAKQGSSGCRSAQELDGRGKTMADLGPPHSFWQKGFTQPSTVDWPAIPVSPDVQAVVTGRAPTAQEQWETMADRLCEQAEIAAPKLAPPDAPSNRVRDHLLSSDRRSSCCHSYAPASCTARASSASRALTTIPLCDRLFWPGRAASRQPSSSATASSLSRCGCRRRRGGGGAARAVASPGVPAKSAAR
jgi:hypothetical protein